MPQFASLPRGPLLTHELRAAYLTVGRMKWCPLVDDTLQKMDAEQLMRASLRTRLSTNNVKEFMRRTVDENLQQEMQGASGLEGFHLGADDVLANLDRPIVLNILNRLLLADRVRFGQTSRHNHHLCSVVLQSMISDVLTRFGMRYGDIKLLQSATGTLISGSTVAALVHTPFNPNDIDFYCAGRRSYYVVHYLMAVVGLEFGDFVARDDYENCNWIRGVWWLRSPGGGKVNVIETYSDNPLSAVLSFHSSPPRGVITWDRFRHFEANQVVRGRALVTQRSLRIRFDDPSNTRACWRILRKYFMRGFTFVTEFEEEHKCGRHLDCPISLRTTSDAGTMQVPLLGYSIPRWSAAPETVQSWVAGISPCRNGKLEDGVSDVYPSTSFEDAAYRAGIQQLLELVELPEGAIVLRPPAEQDVDSDDDLIDVASD
ncbi:hypothetical protein C8R43DRAFT_1139633 [Mycena crocata]|nr:hypothetical protein C8R43DRAFT_1139633 [Mycena crocata]